jgi:hypothetical protein
MSGGDLPGPANRNRLPLSRFLKHRVLKRFFELPPNDEPPEKRATELQKPNDGSNGSDLNRIQAGHAFEAGVIRDLYFALQKFRSVTLYYANGDLVTPDNFDQKTQGTDLFIEIESASDKAAQQVARKVRRVIKEFGDVKSPNL